MREMRKKRRVELFVSIFVQSHNTIYYGAQFLVSTCENFCWWFSFYFHFRFSLFFLFRQFFCLFSINFHFLLDTESIKRILFGLTCFSSLKVHCRKRFQQKKVWRQKVNNNRQSLKLYQKTWIVLMANRIQVQL